MTVLIWVIIVLLFILSFIGVLFPLVPSVLAIWASFLLYHFALNGDVLTVLFWIVMAVLTSIAIISDIIANSYFVKRFGGSVWGERGAGIAVIIGSFIIPPFGILIIPVITVFTIELTQKYSVKEALLASLGSFIGFLSGVLAKVFLQIIMIVWFIITII